MIHRKKDGSESQEEKGMAVRVRRSLGDTQKKGMAVRVRRSLGDTQRICNK